MRVIITIFALLFVAAILFPIDLSATRDTQLLTDAGPERFPDLGRGQDNNPLSDQRPVLKAEGAKIITLKGSEMGLPKSALPGAKFITYAQWKDMKKIPKTGLYLVNISFVPGELPARLKAEGYTLKQDGTLLDTAGSPVAVFTSSDYFQLQPEQKTGGQKPGWANGRRAGSLINSFAGAEPPGDPYAYRCVATSGWSVYHGGFCRDYVARTYLDAYGLDARGGCSRSSPHTRIASIETRAEIGRHRDRDSCRACDSASSRAEWDIGCWWPAHGGADFTTHFVDSFDLGIRFTRLWRYIP